MIACWMNGFFLRLNAAKTKILIVMPPSLINVVSIRGTFIDENRVRFVNSAKNLGVVLINCYFKTKFMLLRHQKLNKNQKLSHT